MRFADFSQTSRDPDFQGRCAVGDLQEDKRRGCQQEGVQRSHQRHQNSRRTLFFNLSHLQKKVGVLAKDKFQGKFMTEWDESYSPVKPSLDEVDISPGIAMAMSVKDEDEQVSTSLPC
jgi:nucleosome binding factor SPN SPT16 subunit